MRVILGVTFASLFWVGVIAEQAPAAKRAQTPATKRDAKVPAAKAAGGLSASHVGGTLAQVMRANLFHNSNLIFAAQSKDPADPKNPLDASFGIFAKVYYGWAVIENAAIALIEAPDFILKPGRLCSNGRPVPVERSDFRNFAEALSVAGTAALKAARSKNMDNMTTAGSMVADACKACHSVYRDNPDLDDVVVGKELFEATLRKQTASRCLGYAVN